MRHTFALLTAPRALLRLEGATTLAIATALYGIRGGSWALFAALLLAPDLSMLGYRAGPVAGAACYNAAHTYLVPIALGVVGLAAGSTAVPLMALIWAAHIGLDRALGYGLKYPDGFTATHLGGSATLPVRTETASPRARLESPHSFEGQRRWQTTTDWTERRYPMYLIPTRITGMEVDSD